MWGPTLYPFLQIVDGEYDFNPEYCISGCEASSASDSEQTTVTMAERFEEKVLDEDTIYSRATSAFSAVISTLPIQSPPSTLSCWLCLHCE